MQLIETCLELAESDLDHIIFLLKSLKFTSAIIELKNDLFFQKVSELISNGNISSLNENFKLYLRKTLQDQGEKHHNKKNIDFWRNKCHFLIQKCDSPEMTKWASQEQRIDALTFDLLLIHQLLDLSTARMMYENEKFLEIPVSKIIQPKRNLIKISRNLLKSLKRVNIKEVPIIFSSFASSHYDLIGMHELKGILSFLDIDHEYYFDLSQIKLNTRLNRNQKRLGSDFLAPGIISIEK